MGVPGYVSAATRACPGAESCTTGPVTTLLVDFNCVAHSAVREDCDEQDADVIARAIALLDLIVLAVSPSRSLVVCADGVPPEAKMAQQRARRLASALARPGPRPIFDRNCITPGTAFSAALDAALDAHCKIVGGSGRLSASYSGTSDPGEGEQKIVAHIRNTDPAADERFCIFGNDADLVVLSTVLMAQGRRAPAVCREPPARAADAPFRISHLDAGRIAVALSGGWEPRLLWNHVVCSFLCGNDFLPPLSCLSLRRSHSWMHRLREACSRHGLSLVRDGALSWPDIARLVGAVSATEDSDFRSVDEEFWRTRRWAAGASGLPVPASEIRPGTPDWRARYYAALHGFRCHSGIRRVVGEYVRGIRWVFGYYSGEFHPHAPDWHYRYSYGPTSLDLFNLLASTDSAPDSADISLLPATSHSPAELLRFVTPYASRGLLPQGQQLRSPSHLFPSDCPRQGYLRWTAERVLQIPYGRCSEVSIESQQCLATGPSKASLPPARGRSSKTPIPSSTSSTSTTSTPLTSMSTRSPLPSS